MSSNSFVPRYSNSCLSVWPMVSGSSDVVCLPAWLMVILSGVSLHLSPFICLLCGLAGGVRIFRRGGMLSGCIFSLLRFTTCFPLVSYLVFPLLSQIQMAYLPCICNSLELEPVILHGICHILACYPSILHGICYIFGTSTSHVAWYLLHAGISFRIFRVSFRVSLGHLYGFICSFLGVSFRVSLGFHLGYL